MVMRGVTTEEAGGFDFLEGSPQVEPKAFNVVEEILHSEERYQRNLRFIIDDLGASAQGNAPEGENLLVGPSDANRIFPVLEHILKLHCDIIYPELLNRSRNWKQNPQIGTALSGNDLEEAYLNYIDVSSTWRGIFTSWKKVPANCEILDRLNYRYVNVSGSLSLIEDCVCIPIQRTTRLQILMERYQKDLSSSALDKSAADDSVKQLKALNTMLNDRLGNQARLSEVSRITDDLDWNNCGRNVIKYGWVTRHAKRSRFLVLCKNIFTIYKPVLYTRMRKVKEVETIKVSAEAEDDDPKCFNLISVSINGPTLHEADSEEERDKWLEAFREATAVDKKSQRNAQGLEE